MPTYIEPQGLADTDGDRAERRGERAYDIYSRLLKERVVSWSAR
jgi:hypothetical protein